MRLFDGLRPPAAPERLRERALAAARATAKQPETAPRASWVDRVWESQGVRWAWAAVVAVLLIGHLAAWSRRSEPPSLAEVGPIPLVFGFPEVAPLAPAWPDSSALGEVTPSEQMLIERGL